MIYYYEDNNLKFALSNDNLKKIYYQIRKNKVISRFDLIELTSLKSGTVTRYLDQLLREDLIVEVGQGKSTGGRRPILYQVNPEYGYVLGLNISRNTSSLVLCDLLLNVKELYTWNIEINLDPYEYFDKVIKCINEILNKHNIKYDLLLGLGIAAFGPLDSKSRILINPYGFLNKKWRNIKICDYFESKLKIKVFLDNGACCALRGEFWVETNHAYKNIVYIHPGVGFRSAIMSGGKIISGAIGQMIIQTDGIPPHNPYGNYGSLHSYVIIDFIISEVKNHLKKGRQSTLRNLITSIEELTFMQVITGLKLNDALVTEVFKQSANYLGIGLANLINILNPQKIILGGPIIEKSELYHEVAIETAIKKTYYSLNHKVIFAKPKLGENGMAIGAGAMVIDDFSS